MSHFYGTLIGSRKPRTATGTAGSGIKAVAQSWSGSISVELYVDEEGKDCYEIRVGEGSDMNPRGPVIAEGFLKDLI